MDINLTPVNSSSESLTFVSQDIEKKDDFSNIIKRQEDVLQNNLENISPKEVLSELNKEILERPSEPVQEKINLEVGKELPGKELKKHQPKDNSDNNDSAINIYSQLIEFPYYVKAQNISDSEKINFILTPKISIEPNLSNETEVSEKIEIQNSILESMPDLTKNSKEYHPIIATRTTNTEIEKNKSNKEIKKDIDLDYVDNSENKNDLGNQNLTINNMLNVHAEQQSTFKLKNHNQFTSPDGSIEMSEFNSGESGIRLYETPPTENLSTIEYNSNSPTHFEKELGEHLVSMIKENNHQVTLKIDPPELGKMDINLDLLDNKANVSFYTSNLQAKAIIEASLNDLRNLFDQQALSLGDVHVFHHSSDGQRKNPQEYYESRENERLGGVTNIIKDNLESPLSLGKVSVFV